MGERSAVRPKSGESVRQSDPGLRRPTPPSTAGRKPAARPRLQLVRTIEPAEAPKAREAGLPQPKTGRGAGQSPAVSAQRAALGKCDAFPDRDDCLMCCVVEINDDLLDEDTCKPLLGAHSGARRVPGYWQVVGQHQQAFSVVLRLRGSNLIHSREPLFHLCNTLKSYAQAGLQFTSNRMLGGVDCLVSACSK